jgi:carbon-monoxide dehydrogenase medium subunit
LPTREDIMRSAPFALARVARLADAPELVVPGAVLMAGGQVLMPELKLRRARAERVIDLSSSTDGRDIAVDAEVVTIGALVTCAELVESSLVRANLPHLAQAAAAVGDPQTRARATLGGNLAWADPRANLLVALWPTRAMVVCLGRNGVRRIGISDLAVGFRRAALSDEVILGVEVPVAKGVYLEEARQKQELALASVSVVPEAAGVRIAVGGVAPTPVLFRAADTSGLRHHASEDLPRGYGPWSYRLGLAEALLERALARLEGSEIGGAVS